MNKLIKKRKNAAAVGAVLLAIMLTAAACGASENAPDNKGETNDKATASPVDRLPENNGVLEPDAPKQDEDHTHRNNGGEELITSKPISAEGVFTGQIDSISVEITTENGAAAYHVPEQLAPIIEALPTDANVKFEYEEKTIAGATDNKQLWLTKIKAVQ